MGFTWRPGWSDQLAQGYDVVAVSDSQLARDAGLFVPGGQFGKDTQCGCIALTSDHQAPAPLGSTAAFSKAMFIHQLLISAATNIG